MGAWGTSLYANDSASDIRGDYVDKLRRGKSNEEATKELIDANGEIFGDPEEEPLFWFALADTQWNYGRLLSEVKEKALFFLEQNEELERWKESGQKKQSAWKKTLDTLKEKLNSPQPQEKKVYGYRLYHCKWKRGDVFAYRFSGDYSKEKGFHGKYVVFKKIAEEIWWPGHIIPVVEIYKWIGEDILSINDLKKVELLPAYYGPETIKLHPDTKIEYGVAIVECSEKEIPRSNLTFLNNVFRDDHIIENVEKGHRYYAIGWDPKKYYKANFERYVIDMYLGWKDYNRNCVD